MTDEQRKQLSIELDQEAERAALRIRENFRATQPQPCTRFWNAGTVEWIAKLSEETNEVVQAALKVRRLAEVDGNFHDAEVNLAEELTDVITVCTSWLHALGYDKYLRGEVQKRVNEKNKARGYF